MTNQLLEEAKRLYSLKQYQQAFELFLQCDSKCMERDYYLGAMYRMGQGVLEDQKEAFLCFLSAARKGHVEAAFVVGAIYSGDGAYVCMDIDIVKCDQIKSLRKSEMDDSIFQDEYPFDAFMGYGVKPNKSEAFKWVLYAASNNLAVAQYTLGEFYEYGVGVLENIETSLMWYHKAAKQKFVKAFHKLSDYAIDQGDFEQAIEYLLIAYSYHDQSAPKRIADLYHVKREYEEAQKWYLIGAFDYQCYESFYMLGEYYKDGKTEGIQIDTAVRYYKEAIKLYDLKFPFGYASLEYQRLYELYKLGYQDVITIPEIIEFLEYQMDSSNEDYLNELKDLFLSGYQVKDETKDYFQLLDEAINGNKNAQIVLGYKYLKRSLLNTSRISRYIDWYHHMALDNDVDATYLLSRVYVTSDEQEYVYLLKKACSMGHIQACYELGNHYFYDLNKEAINYYEIASKSNLYAQISLGYIYAHGIFEEINYQKSYQYYQLAAKNIMKVQDIDELKKICYIKTKYNCANDNALSFAQDGDIDALLYLGCLYQYGFEVKRNRSKAIYYYDIANKLGSVEATKQLVLLERRGENDELY